jgi:hypothetical protein
MSTKEKAAPGAAGRGQVITKTGKDGVINNRSILSSRVAPPAQASLLKGRQP